MNPKALYNLTYGVYFLSANENGKDNACIINTAVQVANNPTRVSIAVIKGTCTHDMIAATGKCNLSAITTDAPFSLFQHFGMQSGRTVEKFASFTDVARSENGIDIHFLSVIFPEQNIYKVTIDFCIDFCIVRIPDKESFIIKLRSVVLQKIKENSAFFAGRKNSAYKTEFSVFAVGKG